MTEHERRAELEALERDTEAALGPVHVPNIVEDTIPVDWKNRVCPWIPVPRIRALPGLLKAGELAIEQIPPLCVGPVCMAWREGDCTRVASAIALETIAIELIARSERGL